ncbi:MAG TPA: glutamate carboxypeptidase [Burkholderiales bacterium]|nr:glutamate carboxypeptidase [Burkholderiales bacterium]
MRSWTAFLAAAAFSASISAAPLEPVRSLAQKEKPAVIDTLRELVNIESGSRDREGLDRISEVLRVRLAALGGKVAFVEPGADVVKLFDTPEKIGRVVVARFEGTGRKNVMLLAHMDTVYARGTLAKRPFRVEGDKASNYEGARAYGPGVADDKGGIAVVLHTLAILKALGFSDYRVLTVVVNADEEVSTPGARNLITRVASEHDVVLSCESTPAPKDELAVTTAGIGAATIVVHGRAAHAGMQPEDGRNALLELAHQMLATRNLSDPSKGIKFNWTIAHAGTVRNAIPDLATANADVRVRRIADYDAIEKAFRDGVARSQLIPDTTVEASFERRRPPLEINDRQRALVKRAQGIYAEIGKQLGVDDSGKGGGTDAAFAALSGKPVVLENFGLMGYGQHSQEAEYVELDSIEPRLYLLARMIMEAGRE